MRVERFVVRKLLGDLFMSVQIYVIDSADRKRLEETGEVSRETMVLMGQVCVCVSVSVCV